MLRIARSTRGHTRNRLDSNDTSAGKAGKFQPGRIGPSRAAPSSSPLLQLRDPRPYRIDLRAQAVEWNVIGVGLCANQQVAPDNARKKPNPDQLAKTAAQTISIDGRVFVLRNDDAGSRPELRGSSVPDIQMRGLHLPPPSPHGLDIRFLREAPGARKTESATLRRTLSGAGRSTACGPSCGAC